MHKTNLLALVFVVAGAGVAQAGGQAGSIGAGAEYQLSGAGGASVNYDAGAFHVGGFLGYIDQANGGGAQDPSDFMIGARFYYHVHSTAMSDFGVGGGFGVISDGYDVPGGGTDRATLVYLEPSFQIRLFLASNVALSFSTGILIGLVDASDPSPGPYADGILLGGQLNAGAGVHYYFF
jgi:hypothetical protein